MESGYFVVVERLCPVQSFHAPAGQPPEPQHYHDVEGLLGEELEDMAITLLI